MSTQFDLLDLLINESIVDLPVKKKVQLDALVHKCVKIFEIRADQQKTGLQFTDREAVWVTCCDKTLPIIVTILLDNAIRYSPENTTVRVHVRREGPKANLVVENTGEMKLSPDRMYKKNERGITNIEGTGFGLYFAQKIAHQHGGELRCSTPKGRVVFTFSLPAKD